MSAILQRVGGWFAPKPKPAYPVEDAIGDRLHALVEENARARADNCRSYEARVRSMFDDLFLRMERDARRSS